jgi:hypothetical protein
MTPPPVRIIKLSTGLGLTSVPEGRTGQKAKYTKREVENKLLSFVNFYLAFLIRPE